MAGFLSKEQARSHPLKNVVTRALGGDAEVDIDVGEWPVEKDDLFLLCSDGLSSMVADETVAAVIEDAGRDPTGAAEALVAAANERGGHGEGANRHGATPDALEIRVPPDSRVV